MENTFATFKPIELKSSPSKEDISQYYKENGLILDNDYLNDYLGLTPPVATAAPKTTTKNPDGRYPIMEQRTRSTYQSDDEESFEIDTDLPTQDIAKEVIKYFTNAGYTKEQAAGIAGNLYAESGLIHSRPQVNGSAFGLAQWEPPRQADFKRVIGKDITESTLKEQLDFIKWELDNTEIKAKKALLTARTPQQSARIFANEYERMKVYNREREGYAFSFYNS